MRYDGDGTAALDADRRPTPARAIAHPLLDRALWGASPPPRRGAGFARPDDALRLRRRATCCPTSVVARRTKASFDACSSASHARAFARDWDGARRPGRARRRRRAARALGAARRPTRTPSRCCRPRGWRQPAIASSSRSAVAASESQSRGRVKRRCGSALRRTSAAGSGGTRRTPRCGSSALRRSRAAERLDRDRVAPLERDPAAQRQLGRDGGERDAPALARADAAHRLAGRRAARAASSRRSIERGPASAVVAVEDQHVVADDADAGAREPGERRALARGLVAQHGPDAVVGDDPAAVEALAPEPARHHERHRRQVADGRARRRTCLGGHAAAPPATRRGRAPPSPRSAATAARGRRSRPPRRRAGRRPAARGRARAAASPPARRRAASRASGTPVEAEPVGAGTGPSRSGHCR